MATLWRGPHKRGRKTKKETDEITVHCADCGEEQVFSYVECRTCGKPFCMRCANYIGERQWICYGCLTGKKTEPDQQTSQL